MIKCGIGPKWWNMCSKHIKTSIRCIGDYCVLMYKCVQILLNWWKALKEFVANCYRYIDLCYFNVSDILLKSIDQDFIMWIRLANEWINKINLIEWMNG